MAKSPPLSTICTSPGNGFSNPRLPALLPNLQVLGMFYNVLSEIEQSPSHVSGPLSQTFDTRETSVLTSHDLFPDMQYTFIGYGKHLPIYHRTVFNYTTQRSTNTSITKYVNPKRIRSSQKRLSRWKMIQRKCSIGWVVTGCTKSFDQRRNWEGYTLDTRCGRNRRAFSMYLAVMSHDIPLNHGPRSPL
jgi:hypothetical protein